MSNWRFSQYTHNRDLARSLNPDDYPDWRITTMFYAALQLVDMVFADEYDGLTPSSHAGRTKFVYRSTRTRRVAAPYDWLRSRSEEARYSRHYSDTDPALVATAERALDEIAECLLTDEARERG